MPHVVYYGFANIYFLFYKKAVSALCLNFLTFFTIPVVELS